MIFTNNGSKGIEITFEESDNQTDMRIVEQGVALIRNILQGLNEGRTIYKEIKAEN